MNPVNRLVGVLRRPWSKPTLVLVTALVAGLAGYGVAATRPKEKQTAPPPTMLVESWLSEMERDPAEVSVGDTAEEALAAKPADVEVVAETVVAQSMYQMGGSGLLALPAGEWAVYVSCRVDDASEVPADFTAGLSISGTNGEDYVELKCPTDGREPLSVLRPTEDTVYSFALSPVASDMGDDEDFWEVAMAAGVFVGPA